LSLSADAAARDLIFTDFGADRVGRDIGGIAGSVDAVRHVRPWLPGAASADWQFGLSDDGEVSPWSNAKVRDHRLHNHRADSFRAVEAALADWRQDLAGV